MPTAAEYMQVRAPTYYADPDRDTLIAQAELETGDYGSEAMTNKAVFLLVCHWLALEARDGAGGGVGAAGMITNEKEGDLARGYGRTVGSAESRSGDLEQTRWGLELLAHRKNHLILPRTRLM